MITLRATGLQLALAIGLSFTLWAFVSFSQNPEEQVPFDGLPVEMRGLNPALVLVDQNGLPKQALPAVDVVIETDRETRGELRQVDLRAFVDLSGLEAGDRVVPVNIERTRAGINFGVALNGISPPAIPIRIEPLITQTVPITVNVQGNVPFSFAVGKPEVRLNNQTIGEVRISGPQGRVERVREAYAVANIDQLRANYVSVVQLQAIDEAGRVVEGVTLEPSSVTVRIPINPIVGLKLVPVLARIVGAPAPGFVITSVTANPQLVNITGSSGTLDDVERVETAPIDISGARTTTQRNVVLRFPFGTSPQRGEPSEAMVTVAIAPISQPFQLQLPVPVQIVGVPDGMLVSLSPVLIEVTVTGNASSLNRIGPATLLATVDATGFNPGTYQVTPQLVLPEGITLVGDLPTVTMVLRLPSSPTPEPTSVPSSTAIPTPTLDDPPALPPNGTPTPAPDEPAPDDSPVPSASTPTVSPPTSPTIAPPASLAP